MICMKCNLELVNNKQTKKREIYIKEKKNLKNKDGIFVKLIFFVSARSVLVSSYDFESIHKIMQEQ